MSNTTTQTASAGALTIQIPAHLATIIESKKGQFNVMPTVALQAMQLAKDPDCEIKQFASIIERDVKLTTDILRMANSILFSGGTPVQSLHQAVIRLGFRQCKNLILSSSISSLMSRMKTGEAWVRELLWRHSFVTGLLSVHLNRVFRAGFGGEEFTAGLIHDFGRTLLAFCLPAEFASADPLDFQEDEHTLARETQALGINHAELGAWFAQQNQLPTSLQEVIMYHHQPQQASESRLLVTLVSIADQIANHLQRQGSDEGLVLDQISGFELLEEMEIRLAQKRLEEQLPEIVKQTLSDAAQLSKG